MADARGLAGLVRAASLAIIVDEAHLEALE
jgi:hypothetical protein